MSIYLRYFFLTRFYLFLCKLGKISESSVEKQSSVLYIQRFGWELSHSGDGNVNISSHWKQNVNFRQDVFMSCQWENLTEGIFMGKTDIWIMSLLNFHKEFCFYESLCISYFFCWYKKIYVQIYCKGKKKLSWKKKIEKNWTHLLCCNQRVFLFTAVCLTCLMRGMQMNWFLTFIVAYIEFQYTRVHWKVLFVM